MKASLKWVASGLAVLAVGGWACPADGPATAGGSGAATEVAQLRACELVNLAAARAIIGADATNPGDTEETTCIYVNPGVAMLTIRIDTGDMYDRLTISTPHTPQAIGEKGRSHAGSNGNVSVQFLQGGMSVTMGANPIGVDPVDYMPALLDGARAAAERIN